MKWRPSNGFSASTSIEFHGTWRNSALRLAFETVPLRATLLTGPAAFLLVFFVEDFLGADFFDFAFFMSVAQ